MIASARSGTFSIRWSAKDGLNLEIDITDVGYGRARNRTDYDP
jgi:hypothetical protein